MLHTENAQVDTHAIDSIEGRQNTGTFLIKPLMHGDSMMLLEVRVRAGAGSPIHAHSHESLIYVVSGRLETTIDNKTFVLGPGDVCRHPSAVDHRVEALEDTVFIEAKSPPPDLHQIFGLATESGKAP
jgi:quercetin dioxygenase-like cupin family protein